MAAVDAADTRDADALPRGRGATLKDAEGRSEAKERRANSIAIHPMRFVQRLSYMHACMEGPSIS